MTNVLAGSVCAQPLPHCAPRWSRMKLPHQAFLSSLPCHVLCVPFQDGSGSRMDLLNSLGGIQLIKESDFLFFASSPLKEIQCSPKLMPLWLLLAESTGPASACCHPAGPLGQGPCRQGIIRPGGTDFRNRLWRQRITTIHRNWSHWVKNEKAIDMFGALKVSKLNNWKSTLRKKEQSPS